MKKNKQNVDDIISLNINGGIYKFDKDELNKRIEEYKKLIEINFNECIDIYVEKHLTRFKNKIKKQDLTKILCTKSPSKFYRDLKSGNITVDMMLRALFIFGINPRYLLLGKTVTQDNGCFMSEDNYSYLTEKNKKDTLFSTIKKIYDLQSSEVSLVRKFIEGIVENPERKPLKIDFAEFCKNNGMPRKTLKHEIYNIGYNETKIDEVTKADLHRHDKDLIKNDKIIENEKYRKERQKGIRGKQKVLRKKATCYIDEQGCIRQAKTHELLGYFEPLYVDKEYIKEHQKMIEALKRVFKS